MPAADEIVMAIRLARAEGKSEAQVQAIVRRMADQYSAAELKAAQAQLAAALAGGR